MNSFDSAWPPSVANYSPPLKDSDDTSELFLDKACHRLLPSIDIRKSPIPRTRDFSRFLFPEVPLTENDKEDIYKSRCIKFQTPEYVAYIHNTLQNYIREEHLYNSNDTPAMKAARRSKWDLSGGISEYNTRKKHPQECEEMDALWHRLDNQHTRDNREILGDVLVNEVERIEKKYTGRPIAEVSIEFLKTNPKKISLVAGTTIAVAVFFCFPTVQELFFSSHALSR